MRNLKIVFAGLVGIFIVIVAYFAVPFPIPIRQKLFPGMAILAFIFFILGIVLLIFTFKLKIKGALKKYLILTGAAPVIFLASIILHNFVYGLGIYFFGQDFWGQAGDEAFFFILGLFICPIIFLVGLVGSMVYFKKSKAKK